jgi:hypothetical protein
MYKTRPADEIEPQQNGSAADPGGAHTCQSENTATALSAENIGYAAIDLQCPQELTDARSKGIRNEDSNRSYCNRELRARCWLCAKSVVVVSSRQQHAELAESGNQERACKVQESAEAVFDSYCQPVCKRERRAAGSSSSSHIRYSRRAGGGAIVESGVVVGRQ